MSFNFDHHETNLGNGGDVELGLRVVLFVVQFGGAALFRSRAQVATFVFICPARRKFFPENKSKNKDNLFS